MSNIKYGTALGVDQMTDMLMNPVSSNTNAHHTYSSYHVQPSLDAPPPGVDHRMDDGFEHQKCHSNAEKFNRH